MSSIIVYGFMALIVFAFLTDNGVEIITKAIVTCLLKVVDLFARVREYFTSRSRNDIVKRIECAMHECIEDKE